LAAEPWPRTLRGRLPRERDRRDGSSEPDARVIPLEEVRFNLGLVSNKISKGKWKGWPIQTPKTSSKKATHVWLEPAVRRAQLTSSRRTSGRSSERRPRTLISWRGSPCSMPQASRLVNLNTNMAQRASPRKCCQHHQSRSGSRLRAHQVGSKQNRRGRCVAHS
jgi:hypothetical protein